MTDNNKINGSKGIKMKFATEPNEEKNKIGIDIEQIKKDLLKELKNEIKKEIENLKNDCIYEVKKLIPFTQKSHFFLCNKKK